MAHHFGMAFVALTNALTSQVWQRRFHTDPLVRSAELLLHERIPRRLVLQEPMAGPDDEGRRRRTEPTVGAAAGDARHATAARGAAGSPALHHHGEPLRRRLQPLRDARGHPLALGRDPRLHRAVLLREGPVDRTGLVGGAPAGVRAGGLVQRPARHRPGHVPSGRRRHRDPHRDRRRAGGFGRGAAHHPHQQQRRDPRDRAHQLRRDRARAARGRPRPPGVRQPLRRDRVARVVYRDHRHPAPPLGQGAAALVRARGRHRQGAGGLGDLRDRPGPLPGPGPLDPRPGGARAGWRALRHDRRGARPDLRAAHPGAAGAGTVGVGRVHHAGRRPAASGPSSWPTATAIPTPRSGRSIWPGPRPGGAARVRHHARRCGRLPGAGRPPALWKRGAAGAAGGAAPEPRLPAAAVGQRRLRRLADSAGHHRLGRGAAHSAPALRGASLLAPPRHDGRSGRAQRAPAHLSPGAGRPDHGRGVCHGRHRLARQARRRVHPAQGPDERRRAPHAARHRAGAHPLRRPRARPHPGDRDAGGVALGRHRLDATRPPRPGAERLAGVARSGASSADLPRFRPDHPDRTDAAAFRPSRTGRAEARAWRWTTASAASPTRATTRSGSPAIGCRRRRGPTSSPTGTAASWSPSGAADSPGPRTATSSG